MTYIETSSRLWHRRHGRHCWYEQRFGTRHTKRTVSRQRMAKSAWDTVETETYWSSAHSAFSNHDRDEATANNDMATRNASENYLQNWLEIHVAISLERTMLLAFLKKRLSPNFLENTLVSALCIERTWVQFSLSQFREVEADESCLPP